MDTIPNNLLCLALSEQGAGLFSRGSCLFSLQVFYFHLCLLLESLSCNMKAAQKSKRIFLHPLYSKWLSTRPGGTEGVWPLWTRTSWTLLFTSRWFFSGWQATPDPCWCSLDDDAALSRRTLLPQNWLRAPAETQLHWDHLAERAGRRCSA